MKSFKDYLKEAEVTVTKVSPADAWKKHTGQDTKKSKVPVDPKTGKTLYQKVQGVEEGHQLPGKDEHYTLRNNIWTLYDGDEIVHEYRPERGEIVGAKKLLARFDDKGYDVTHVVSPMGVTTYLYGKPEDEIDEGAGKGIMINGKEVDMTSLEIDGVDSRDYPDFADAYFSAGYFTDGTPMSDEELDQFQNENGDLLYDKAYDSLHEEDMKVIKDRAGVNKSDIPAYKRKNSGDPDWKVSHDDLKKEREKSATSPEGLAALKRRMGMIEDGDQ